MLILPAVDIRDGRCVRLTQGDYARETVYFEDPLEAARRWEAEGARYLHVVDLDGARAGEPRNLAAIERIIKGVGIPVEAGGGLRTEEAVKNLLDLGADRAVLGTRAIQTPDWVAEICRAWPDRIAVSVDMRDGEARLSGWETGSGRTAQEAARILDAVGAAAVIFTDIGRDGMLAGPNLAAIGELAAALATPVIASGGVTGLEDVRNLCRLDLAGAIIGKALYAGTLRLAEALAAAKGA